MTNYREEILRYYDIINQADVAREKFFRHILLVAASILGIITALHSSNIQQLHIALVYSLAVGFLALGILLAGVVVYDYSQSFARIQKAYHNELQSAMFENRSVKDIQISTKKRTKVYSILCLIFFLISLLALTIYSILIVFSLPPTSSY